MAAEEGGGDMLCFLPSTVTGFFFFFLPPMTPNLGVVGLFGVGFLEGLRPPRPPRPGPGSGSGSGSDSDPDPLTVSIDGLDSLLEAFPDLSENGGDDGFLPTRGRRCLLSFRPESPSFVVRCLEMGVLPRRGVGDGLEERG